MSDDILVTDLPVIDDLLPESEDDLQSTAGTDDVSPNDDDADEVDEDGVTSLEKLREEEEGSDDIDYYYQDGEEY